MAQLDQDVRNYLFYQLLSTQLEGKNAEGRYSERSQLHTRPAYRILQRRSIEERRKTRNQTEIEYKREVKHFWSKRMYFIYTMLMGNGVDGLPQTIRVTFEISGFVFIFVRFMAILIFLLPVMDVEVFMGTYSKLSNSQMYRMAPLAFGLSIMNFVFNVLYVPILMTEVPILLLGAIRLTINPEYMANCRHVPKRSMLDFCFDYKEHGTLINDTCHRAFMSLNCTKHGRIAYASQFYFWHDYYNYDETFATTYDGWPLIVVCCISWFVLLTVVLFKMKYIEGFFVFSSLFYLVSLVIIIVMVVFTDGATKGLWDLATLTKFPSFKTIGMVVTMTTINLKLISPVGHMTYAAFLKEGSDESNKRQEFRAHKTGVVAELLHLLCGTTHILVVAMIGGILATVYEVDNALDMFIPRVGMYYAMIMEFLHYKQVANVFQVMYFLSVWSLEISKLAIVVHFQIMNIIDFFPSVFRFENYVIIAWGFISFGLTLLMTYKYIFWFLPTYHMANVYFIEAARLFALSFILFYVYGIKRIEDDVQFQTGKDIPKFWKIIWPIYPLLYLTLFFFMVYASYSTEEAQGLEIDMPYNSRKTIFATGLGLSAVYIVGALGFQLLYIVLSIGSNTTMSNLIKPDFHWGPSDPKKRRQRKDFAPRVKIRSLHIRTRLQRYRQNSIRQMHEQDLTEGIQCGRVFLDGGFYTNCNETIQLQETNSTRRRYVI